MSWGKRRKIENVEAQKQMYLEAVPRLFTVAASLKAAGVTPSALARWREEDGAFLVAERQQRELAADVLEGEAVRRAYKGVRRPVYQGGLLAGHVTEYSDTLLVFLLKGMRPDKYRERAEVSVTPIIKTVAGFDRADVI